MSAPASSDELVRLVDLLKSGNITTAKRVLEENIRDHFNLTADANCTFTIVNVEFLRAFSELVDSAGEQRMAYNFEWAIIQPASLL